MSKIRSVSYHNGDKRLLELLVQHLCADVNAGQPAAITRVTMVPAYGILQPPNLQGEVITLWPLGNLDAILKINFQSYFTDWYLQIFWW